VTTNDTALAEQVRTGRDYGNPGDYDTRFAGLNARMSELHAAMALESLGQLDEHLVVRRQFAATYRAGLAAVPGLRPQQVDDGDESSYKDFTVAVDDAAFGVDRDTLVAVLRAEGIDTRCYFSPPVHRHQAYRDGPESVLPRTDWLADRVVSLPLWRDLPDGAIETVIDVIARVHERADEIRDRGRAACVPS
jgi:dTDP-4-amino-4,6-dideoxygalactose transaminase